MPFAANVPALGLSNKAIQPVDDVSTEKRAQKMDDSDGVQFLAKPTDLIGYSFCEYRQTLFRPSYGRSFGAEHLVAGNSQALRAWI